MEIRNRTNTITVESYLPNVVSRYPSTRAVFDRYGLHGCGGPLGPFEKVGWFARLHGVAINFGIYMPITGSHAPFSHAFFGAYRHALTVGFIMMMIVGVSSKVVPTLSGIDVKRANSLWPTFVLLNLGNLTRVSFQIATDFSPAAYPVMGISGFIEVVGLTLWGYELFSNIRVGKKLEKESGALKFFQHLEITPDTKVGEVLTRYPQSLEIFVRSGFPLLRNPVLRKTMARAITIEQACRREGVDLARLLGELNQLADGEGTTPDRLVSITSIHQAQGI